MRVGNTHPLPEDIEGAPTGAAKTGFNRLAEDQANISGFSTNNKETEMSLQTVTVNRMGNEKVKGDTPE